jgi:hypothetical protein
MEMEMGLWVDWGTLLGVRGMAARPRRDTTYFVVPSVVNVWQGPGTGFAVAGQLQRGTKVLVDSFSTGEKLLGSDQWAHLSVENACRDLGFIHSRLLRKG